jgi:DNA-binding NarL/FixJ family response regulator
LRAIIEETPEFAVVDVVSSAPFPERTDSEPAVILWQLSPDEDAASILSSLRGERVIVLAPHPSLDLLRAGASGVLPPDSTPEQIAAGIRSAALDLFVLSPEAIRSHAGPPPLSPLTARETEILRMIAGGLANKEIAFRLGISEHTVKFHVSSILGKMGAATRAEAIAAGIRQGLVLL